MAAAKRKSPDVDPTTLDKGGKKISLSKSFKFSLANQVMLSDSEVNCLNEKVLSSAFNDTSNYDTSKVSSGTHG